MDAYTYSHYLLVNTRVSILMHLHIFINSVKFDESENVNK